MRRAPCGALASRRSTTALAAATERHRSARATRLPGNSSERPPRWFKRRAHRNAFLRKADRPAFDCVTRGRYPRLTVPVQRDCTRSPVMMPSGRVLPKPPESQGDEPRPAGTALAPPDEVTRPASWYGARFVGNVPHSVTLCQGMVAASATGRRHGRMSCGGGIELKLNALDCTVTVNRPTPQDDRGGTRSALRGLGFAVLNALTAKSKLRLSETFIAL